MPTATRFSSRHPLSPSEEAAFFAALRLRNGTFKTTADHRMDDLNEFITATWRADGFTPATIMDVGASSGVCTVEWHEAMSRAGFDVRITATDLTLWANIVSSWPGVSVLEADGFVLQHMVFGVPIRPWRRRLDYLTGYALLSSFANAIAARRRPEGVNERILLVSHRARQNSAIEWVEDDIVGPNPERFHHRFDAIRAANILNRDYFSTRDLQRAVANLKDRLAGPNARLIINRTWQDNSNHATLFRLKTTGRFETEARFGQGSEVEDIVLAN
jgi:hypothetical protein